MKTTFTATTARAQFFKIIERAAQPGGVVTITLEGEPKIIMMSAEEFEGWQETLDIMGDKNLMRSIKKALHDKKTYSHKEVKKKLGIV